MKQIYAKDLVHGKYYYIIEHDNEKNEENHYVIQFDKVDELNNIHPLKCARRVITTTEGEEHTTHRFTNNYVVVNEIQPISNYTVVGVEEISTGDFIKSIDQFKSLKEKSEYWRDQTNYKLPENSHVIMQFDGRSFSKKWKNKLEKPFDKGFADDMNEVARYLCSNVGGARFAYVQSDEINIYIAPLNFISEQWFGNRIQKMVSVGAALATSKYNQLRLCREIHSLDITEKKICDVVDNFPLSEFDCRVWVAPTWNDVVAHFIYRRNDCYRNAVLNLGYTNYPHNELEGLNTREIVAKVFHEKRIDFYNDYEVGFQFGRFVRKEIQEREVEVRGDKHFCNRRIWVVQNPPVLEEFNNYLEDINNEKLFGNKP